MVLRSTLSVLALSSSSVFAIVGVRSLLVDNCWLCCRQSRNRLSRNRLATTGNAASNSLESIRSGAPNAIVARWCASPPFPLSGSPQSRTPHEHCTHNLVLYRQSPTNAHPSASVCLSLGRSSSKCHFQPSPSDHFQIGQRKIPPSFASISPAIDESWSVPSATTPPRGLSKHIA